jgi:nucleotide-binding universal stress UspA family protein
VLSASRMENQDEVLQAGNRAIDTGAVRTVRSRERTLSDVRNQRRQNHRNEVNSILAAIAFDHSIQRVVECGARTARRLRVPLIVVHVVDASAISSSYDVFHADQELRNVVAWLRSVRTMTVIGLLRTGKPTSTLLQLTHTLNSAALVVGGGRDSCRSNPLTGQVARFLIGRVPTPALVVGSADDGTGGITAAETTTFGGCHCPSNAS